MSIFPFSIIKHTEQTEFLFYAIFGLFIACVPFLMKLRVLTWKVAEKSSLKSSSIMFSLFDKYGFYLSFPLAMMVFLRLVHLHWVDSAAIAGATALLNCVVIFSFFNREKSNHPSKVIQLALILFFSLIAIAFNFSTSFFDQVGVNLSNHFVHWGAFMSAAKSFDAGLAIFKDFPTQYGFGPTVLIALASHWFGWFLGMFYVVGLLQFFYWTSLTIIAIKLTRNLEGNKYFWWTFALFITTFSCYFWIPDSNLYSNQTPSLGGARYLPATFFVAILLSLDLTSQNFSKNKVLIMHAVWALCALWSVESIFHVCLIWWPYYVFINLPANASVKSGFQSIVKSILELLCLAVILIFLFLIIYWFFYNSLPEFSVFTAFVSNVPGPLLISFRGSFIFPASILLLGMSTIIVTYRKYGNSNEFHNLFVLTLLAYAAFSYYIGRSDDYNILPLIPFFSLILLSMIPLIFPRFVRYYSITLLCFLICYVVLIQAGQNFSRLDLFHFNADKLASKFQSFHEDPNKSGLGKAITYISKNYNESTVVIDSTLSITISGNQDQWNAYNNILSYIYLPVSMQKKFVDRSKKKLMKSGWILVHKDMGAKVGAMVGADANPNMDAVSILDLFSNSYNHQEPLIFGDYKAYRFTPKPN